MIKVMNSAADRSDVVPEPVDVCVVGGGQSGLAVAYHLRRANRRRRSPMSVVVVDDRERAGGAWQDGWASLRLFSPAAFSSLVKSGDVVYDG